MSENTPRSVVNVAAYKFVPLDQLAERRKELLRRCRSLELKGTILLSPEGINLFLAGTRPAIDEILGVLRRQPELADLTAKESLSTRRPFGRLMVKRKREIIAFGVNGIDPAKRTSRRLSPRKLQRWLDEGRDVTLLDVRNDYEIDHGTFAHARTIGVASFRQFPQACSELEDDLKQRPLVMFCTGGIRCEKAGPFLEQQGFDEVYQLEGGILKYFEDCGGEHYDGNCFVFDERVALDSELRGIHETRDSDYAETSISRGHC